METFLKMRPHRVEMRRQELAVIVGVNMEPFNRLLLRKSQIILLALHLFVENGFGQSLLYEQVSVRCL